MFYFFHFFFFFFQAEDGIRDVAVTGVQTCALPIYLTACSWYLGCVGNSVKICLDHSRHDQRYVNSGILGFEVHARVRGEYVDPALCCAVDRPVAHEWNSSEKGRDVDQMSSAAFSKVRNDSLHPVENRFKNNRSYLVKVLVCQVQHRLCDSSASVVYPDINMPVLFECLAPKTFNVGSTRDICWHDQSSRSGLFRNLLQFLLASCCEYELMTLGPELLG